MTRYSNKNSVLEQLFLFTSIRVTVHLLLHYFIVTFITFVVTLCIYNFIAQNIHFSSLAQVMDPMKARSDIGQGKKNICIIKLCKFLCHIKLCKCKLLVIFCFIYSRKKWFYFMIYKVYCKQVKKLFFWCVEQINLFYIIYNGKI